MAATESFVQYVCGQMGQAGPITYRKMVGEYAVYLHEKVIGLVCDDQFFLKITKAGEALLPTAMRQPPYPGAKPSFVIEDLENKPFLTALVEATWEQLPIPKPKKKKQS